MIESVNENERKQIFYNLLNSSSDDEKLDNLKIENGETNTDKESLCEITNSTLEDNYIQLSCGHKFNYIPLYNEIKYQKTNKYSLSYDFTKLSINQIKCPYCRDITNNILPYFNYYNLPIIKGVNYPQKYSMKINSCQHCLKTTNKLCNNSACITPNGIFCNKHYRQKIKTLDKSLDKSITNMKVNELKNLLRKNKCRVGGNKSELIQRIENEKKNNPNWCD